MHSHLCHELDEFGESQPAKGLREGGGSVSNPYLGKSQSAGSVGSVSVSPSRPAVYSQAPKPRGGLNKTNLHKKLGFEVLLIEENLKKKLSDQLEARGREAKAREILYSKEAVGAAQAAEALEPLTLAKLFRQMLCFVDEEVAEDPQPGTPLQMPHVKGTAIEEMMITVYQRYCSESGFMHLEGFIEFFEDSAILHTHAPHNDNDEPIEEYVTLLDPVRLLTLVPRNIGFSVAAAYDVVNEQLLAASKLDKFIINFSQFYVMLLRITQIVYPTLFDEDATLAFNKILQEVICPLYTWCQHHKRGSKDTLVLEERILLLMTTYSPNLYRVFLTYAHDAVGRVPEINREFPGTAQSNERGMFRLPAACPAHQVDQCPATDSVFVSEVGCMRFARDYGLIPYVMSVRQIKDAYRSCNRSKVIVSGRLPTRDMLAKPHSTAQLEKSKRSADLQGPMKFASRAQTKSRTGFGSGSPRGKAGPA
eukprot:CAMPEP_0173342112 /NCGR_PEP_ID=MMETSP1144-20121109/10001_1 /TAXON_ID=483371 /ORGANISM="non described non described, Strain CCMP2298" /LENGTH=477 /DNA_ID=CAMNT_0014288619 /DNA_START=491 /DNA_END=1921 /DNA_ORIENTATION=-